MFVLDTNVVSELRKVRLGKTDMNVTAWTQSVDAADLFVSAITIMELELGVLSIERKDPAQGALLRLQHPCCRNTPGRQTVCGPDPLDCPRSHGLGQHVRNGFWRKPSLQRTRANSPFAPYPEFTLSYPGDRMYAVQRENL